MTLFNEYILPLLAGEENTQAFSLLASAGVDVEAAMLYHMWEMDPDNCRIAMTQSQVLDMFQFVFLHDCDPYSFPHRIHGFVSWPVFSTLPLVFSSHVG